MNKTLEVRWHGRGGQGAKSASAILAEVLFEEGKHVQAFRNTARSARALRYAPTTESRIPRYARRCSVQNPNIVVVVDPTMVESANPTEGTTEDAVYLVNSAENAKELRRRLGVSSKAKVLVVDATKITLEELGQNRPNRPSARRALARIHRRSRRVFRQPLYEQDDEASAAGARGQPPRDTARTQRGGLRMSKPQCWQEVPMATIAVGASALKVQTGLWRSMRPVIDAKKCVSCLRCWLQLPGRLDRARR